MAPSLRVVSGLRARGARALAVQDEPTDATTIEDQLQSSFSSFSSNSSSHRRRKQCCYDAVDDPLALESGKTKEFGNDGDLDDEDDEPLWDVREVPVIARTVSAATANSYSSSASSEQSSVASCNSLLMSALTASTTAASYDVNKANNRRDVSASFKCTRQESVKSFASDVSGESKTDCTTKSSETTRSISQDSTSLLANLLDSNKARSVRHGGNGTSPEQDVSFPAAFDDEDNDTNNNDSINDLFEGFASMHSATNTHASASNSVVLMKSPMRSLGASTKTTGTGTGTAGAGAATNIPKLQQSKKDNYVSPRRKVVIASLHGGSNSSPNKGEKGSSNGTSSSWHHGYRVATNTSITRNNNNNISNNNTTDPFLQKERSCLPSAPSLNDSMNGSFANCSMAFDPEESISSFAWDPTASKPNEEGEEEEEDVTNNNASVTSVSCKTLKARRCRLNARRASLETEGTTKQRFDTNEDGIIDMKVWGNDSIHTNTTVTTSTSDETSSGKGCEEILPTHEYAVEEHKKRLSRSSGHRRSTQLDDGVAGGDEKHQKQDQAAGNEKPLSSSSHRGSSHRRVRRHIVAVMRESCDSTPRTPTGSRRHSTTTSCNAQGLASLQSSSSHHPPLSPRKKSLSSSSHHKRSATTPRTIKKIQSRDEILQAVSKIVQQDSMAAEELLDAVQKMILQKDRSSTV